MSQSILCLILITLASLSTCCSVDFKFQECEITPDFPGNKWIKASDVSGYGWNKDSLIAAKRFLKAVGSKSVMIIDNGKLIYSWGNPDKKYYIASIRKSFLSTLFGYYIDSLISLNSTLSDYNIDDINPALTNDQKKVTVEMLLKSSSGILHTAAANDTKNLMGSLKTQPGKEFLYNNWDFNALGTIFEQRTGYKIFNDSIAQKIGMEDFHWETDGRYDFVKGSIHPAYHFYMTARDMARFGLLILNRGTWNGKQIINKSWIDTISSKRITVPDSYGGGSYGYMWWIHDSGKLAEFARIPTDAFSAQGHLSQLILIIPSRNIVIVHRAKRNLDPFKTAKIIKLIIASKQQINSNMENKSNMIGLRTLIYKVPDINKAKEWYSKAIGKEPYFDQSFYVGFNIGGFELGLQPEENPIISRSNNVEPYWGVKNIQKEYDRLIQLGATENEKPTNVG